MLLACIPDARLAFKTVVNVTRANKACTAQTATKLVVPFVCKTAKVSFTVTS